MHKRLTIIRGLPGSGKTTCALQRYPGSLLLEGDQAFTDEHGNYNFEPDRIDPTNYVEVMLDNACKMGVPHVVVTCTSPNTKALYKFQGVAKLYGYEVKKFWIDFDNGNTNLNRHAVPAEVIANMKQSWMKCMDDETYLSRHIGHNEVDVVNHPPMWFMELEMARWAEAEQKGQ